MPKYDLTSEEEAALLELTYQLALNVKIVGCDRRGTDTVDLLCEDGVVGAQLITITNESKFYFTYRRPQQILIGKPRERSDDGEALAQEAEDPIRRHLQGSKLVIITTGLGGDIGTGSALFVAKIVKSMGALTLGVFSFPSKAEGTVRFENAVIGLNKLRNHCDTLIVVPNDQLLKLLPHMSINETDEVANEVLGRIIRGMAEISVRVGLVNPEDEEYISFIKNSNAAYCGIGQASIEEDNSVEAAVHEALTSPLLGDVDLNSIQGVLISIVGGAQMSVEEAKRAVELVKKNVNVNAQIVWECFTDETYEGTINILLVVTPNGIPAPFYSHDHMGC